MNDEQRRVAKQCHSAAFDGSLGFPAIVGRLLEAGFESYAIDFHRWTATDYLASGACVDLLTGATRRQSHPHLTAARSAAPSVMHNAGP